MAQADTNIEPSTSVPPALASEPEPEPEPGPALAYPGVFCGFPDDPGGRWQVPLDPQTPADRRRAERLLEAYPDADGVSKGLARSNLPAQWQHLRDVTVVAERGTATTSVKRIGVRPSPSDGRFVLLLDAKTPDPSGRFALVVEGSAANDAKWRPVAPDGGDATLLPDGATLDLRPWLRAELHRQKVERDPTVRLRAVGRVDLDADGLDEVVVHEVWPEGLYVWLVRYDRAGGSLLAQRLCGDAA